jgi:hypothetical protein
MSRARILQLRDIMIDTQTHGHPPSGYTLASIIEALTELAEIRNRRMEGRAV